MSSKIVVQANQIEGGMAAQKNYILNPAAHKNTSGWATYADAAASSPVDGTGGSPTLTLTRSTSSPLRDEGSFLITTTAANLQGEGASYDFTIDSADKAKVLTFSFDYATDVTIATGDFVVYIYDVTNASLIQPAGYQLQGAVTGINYKHTGSFQTASNSTSYRLIIHRAVTTATATNLKLDNIILGPQVVQYGAPVDSPMAYTPTFTGFGTPSSVNFTSWRDGAVLKIQGTFVNGTPTATEGRITLGYKGVSANVTSKSTLPSLMLVGSWADNGSSSTTDFRNRSVMVETSKTYLVFGAHNSTTSGLNKQNSNGVSGTGHTISLYAEVPIEGWESTVQMSNDTDTRVVAARATSTTATSYTSAGTVKATFSTGTTYDTHGAWSTDTYTVPVSGKYVVKTKISGTQVASAANGYINLYLYKNGSANQTMGTRVYETTASVYKGIEGSGTIDCVAGDTLDVRVTNQSGNTFSANGVASENWISIERLSGPSAIAASEEINCEATTSSQAVTNGNTIIYSSETFDSHGCYDPSTGLFTVPVAGVYSVTASVGTATVAAGAAGEYFGVRLSQTGSVTRVRSGAFDVSYSTTSRSYYSITNALFKCIAGDILKAVFEETLAAVNLDGSATYNYIAIRKVG